MTVRRAPRGFSLIEVVIASALLAVGISAILSAYRSAVSMEGHQERVTGAMHIAESTIEQLLLRYRDDDDLTVGTHPTSALRFDANGVPVATGGFYRTQWVVASGPIAGSRRIDVKVAWDDSGFQREKSIVLTTLRN